MIDITWTGESSSKQTWQKIVTTICGPCVLRRLKQGRIPTNKSSFLEKLAAMSRGRKTRVFHSNILFFVKQFFNNVTIFHILQLYGFQLHLEREDDLLLFNNWLNRLKRMIVKRIKLDHDIWCKIEKSSDQKHNSLPFQKFISFCLIGTVVDNFHVIVRVIRHLFNNDTSTINITDQQ